MKRTHATSLIAAAAIGAVIGYLGELLLVTSGANVIVPPLSLPITLAGVAAIVLILAWPIRRAVTGASKQRVDPFRAMRVAVLAKASSLSGALMVGLGLGIALFLATRAVLPNPGTLWLALATSIGAAVLLAGGLVAEWFCTLPPDDPEADEKEHAHA
ncbi:DUF3180 family protein [Agromyces sp. CFH 90414]|uniref:DUF3180 family protein n=1 Tax=Agromyces agglutinans TaxID=2662258 RepID=A0A6I2F627_9MICO|nr:DUF3180 domain-containing protein [Agromyces agglutinans]MRG60142.1 DUF3180 family protein [Agromyces agglutinans]